MTMYTFVIIIIFLKYRIILMMIFTGFLTNLKHSLFVQFMLVYNGQPSHIDASANIGALDDTVRTSLTE